ncbi:MAG: tRNA guanosine(34) transglycosylase Tgt [Deltaproteobacteria bacterium]|nr:tRNA guanosine(34) transglycosylase Tgt [Deltaproteobacteria bacterium]
MSLQFDITAQDPNTGARAGTLTINGKGVQTPVFMPVGTVGAVRAMTPWELERAGASIVLANTYHLSIRPGEQLIEKAGGLHKFMGWKQLLLTDSGGFQIFSLPKVKVSDEGVSFQYEVDGQKVFLSPERSIQIQNQLGADIIMAFDECVPYPSPYQKAEEAVRRTTQWAKRCARAHTQENQTLFGIIQGSTYGDLRQRSVSELLNIGFQGYAIGGVSVGEGLEIMKEVLEMTVPQLPVTPPRYLMGVGLPEDILASVERGIDMFDCVIPTRYARSAGLFTNRGRIRLTHKKYKRDFYPIEPQCGCYTCQHFSRAYLRHLFLNNEMLASVLASIHNTFFYQNFMRQIQEALKKEKFASFQKDFLSGYEIAPKGPSLKRQWQEKSDSDDFLT